MTLQSELSQKKLADDAIRIAASLKEIVLSFDPTASVILFGSRARGDAEIDSDWDFLVLTKNENTDLFLRELIPEVTQKIELVDLVVISLLVKNRKIWEQDYQITSIYQNIMEDGIAI